MPIDLPRQVLYDRVWAEPIHKLSSEFGLSDVGLAKLCRRYNIPVPPRGLQLFALLTQAGGAFAQLPLQALPSHTTALNTA